MLKQEAAMENQSLIWSRERKVQMVQRNRPTDYRLQQTEHKCFQTCAKCVCFWYLLGVWFMCKKKQQQKNQAWWYSWSAYANVVQISILENSAVSFNILLKALILHEEENVFVSGWFQRRLALHTSCLPHSWCRKLLIYVQCLYSHSDQ